MKKFIISLVLLMIVLGGIVTINYNNSPKELTDTELVERYLIEYDDADFDRIEINDRDGDEEFISYIAWNGEELAAIGGFNRSYYTYKLTK